MITKEQALEAIEDMDDFARMANIEPIGAYKTLITYVEQSEKKIEAFKLMLESCEECTDFDGWLAFMLSADDYHQTLSIFEEEDNANLLY